MTWNWASGLAACTRSVIAAELYFAGFPDGSSPSFTGTGVYSSPPAMARPSGFLGDLTFELLLDGQLAHQPVVEVLGVGDQVRRPLEPPPDELPRQDVLVVGVDHLAVRLLQPGGQLGRDVPRPDRGRGTGVV